MKTARRGRLSPPSPSGRGAGGEGRFGPALRISPHPSPRPPAGGERELFSEQGGLEDRRTSLPAPSGVLPQLRCSEDPPIDIQEEKRRLRKRILEARKAIDAATAAAGSMAIAQRVLELLDEIAARRAVAYLSIGSEVGTEWLCRQMLARGIELALPRIEPDGRMRAVAVDGLDQLIPGPVGAWEPDGDRPLSGPPQVIIVPGVAFSRRGDRLGRGKGYYDRFLSDHRSTLKIAPAFECQIVEHIPTEPHDVPIDRIITPRRVIRTHVSMPERSDEGATSL